MKKLLCVLLLMTCLVSCAQAGQGYLFPVDDTQFVIVLPDDMETVVYDHTLYYSFLDPAAGVTLHIRNSFDTEKDQQILLRKLRDEGNSFVLDEDVSAGDHTFLAYTREDHTQQWTFLLKEGEGYTYAFTFLWPEDQPQGNIPAYATEILSTLHILPLDEAPVMD